jgi:hypothetical protein
MNPQPQIQPLLCVVPYCSKDVDQARQLLHWIGVLSPKLAPHCCLMAADSLVPHEIKVELGNLAKGIFHFAETAVVNVPLDVTGWPKASNAMFRIASQHVHECFKLPFLWLEPDCIPLRPSWLDELAVAYNACPKRFMGAMIASNQPPLPPLHMAGCAVYPNDATRDMAQFTTTEAPWDIANAPYVVPRAYPTPLIQHVWGEPGLPPVFKEVKEATDPVNTVTLDLLRPDAVLFHRVKGSSLIDLLRKKRQSLPPATEPTPATEAPMKRGPGRPRKEHSEPVAA